MPEEFLVLHDYGSEGWQIVKTVSTIGDAVDAREADLCSSGGHVIIVKVLSPLDAYEDAMIEKRAAARRAMPVP